MQRSLFWLLDHYPETGDSVASIHEAALEDAAEADRLGFTSLWLSEHHFRTLSTAPNPAVLLAAIAQRTECIRLGPAVAVLPLRSPIQVAEDYALVDILSGGRLNLGVGCGSEPVEYAPFGVDFESRREIYAENLEAIRERWAAAICGEIGPDSLNIAPLQSPGPPIYVATQSEETAYQVGRTGDSLLTLIPPPSTGLNEVAARVRAHVRGLEEAGHDDGRAEAVVMIFAHVAETEEAARATAVPALARLMQALTGAEWPDAEGLYDQMRERSVGGLGTPTEVSRQMHRLEGLGIGHVAWVSRFGGMPKEAATESLRLLASIGS